MLQQPDCLWSKGTLALCPHSLAALQTSDKNRVQKRTLSFTDIWIIYTISVLSHYSSLLPYPRPQPWIPLLAVYFIVPFSAPTFLPNDPCKGIMVEQWNPSFGATPTAQQKWSWNRGVALWWEVRLHGYKKKSLSRKLFFLIRKISVKIKGGS